MIDVRTVLPIFGLVVLTTAITLPGRAQTATPDKADQEDVIRVTTTLVTVPISVMDRNGRFIPDLKKDQFQLFEDGAAQQIAFFDNSESPFTVALLLDVSDSTVKQLAQIKAAATAFVNELRPDDRVLILTFDQRVTLVSSPTSDRSVLEQSIAHVQSGGGTSLYDALDLTIVKHLKQIRGRKAIVLFTDGVDTTSRGATYESTLRKAEELDALIYGIKYETYNDVSNGQSTARAEEMKTQVVTSRGEPLDVAYKRAGQYLQHLSDKSAGRLYYAASLNHLREIFSRIAAELRQQYSLGYYPTNKSNDKKQRQLRVRVSVPNVALRYRRAYVYAAQ